MAACKLIVKTAINYDKVRYYLIIRIVETLLSKFTLAYQIKYLINTYLVKRQWLIGRGFRFNVLSFTTLIVVKLFVNFESFSSFMISINQSLINLLDAVFLGLSEIHQVTWRRFFEIIIITLFTLSQFKRIVIRNLPCYDQTLVKLIIFIEICPQFWNWRFLIEVHTNTNVEIKSITYFI